MSEAAHFIEQYTNAYKPLSTAYAQANWDAATNGTPENNQREQQAQAALMRYLADAKLHATAKRLHEAGDSDPLIARQLKLIYLSTALYQQDDATIDKITALEAQVREQYYNFRPVVDGRAVSDNELDALLKTSKDSELVREAWEASKEIGAQVGDRIREIARVRNAAARAYGFRDHFQRALLLNEIDEEELMRVFTQLDADTRAPFRALKAEIDRAASARFGLPVAELRPWHYSNRFFQDTPDLGDVNMDAVFADKDPVALAMQTFDGLGMDVRDILARSDLYEREGKNQHAFCTHIDGEGDVRTLNNLRPNHRWNETLLHELGHAVYDKYQDRTLPWLARGPAHLISTEAIALMMGSLTYDAEWLTHVVGVPQAEAVRVAQAAAANDRAQRLIFTRWVLVMTNFERALYGNPEQDLDTLWWDLVETYQMLTRPEGRKTPDWAAKIHVALYPVYYQNYELGYLITAQLQAKLKAVAGGIVGRREAGQWLIEKFFAPGQREDWSAHVKTATGEALNPKYFVDSVQL